ncbi:MAG: HAD hydrolase family protein [Acidobacteriota bacterium]|nr:HAD hydrolase family protein [Acidobacteriota bacterium]
MDCDGVLTDGRITLLTGGDEQKTFHVRDGQGLVLLHRAGLRSGIISGRSSGLVDRRAKELGIEYVRQGTLNKIEDFKEILEQAGTALEETAFVGDDVTDVPLMMRVGFAIAVADAVPETKKVAHLVTKAKGGKGAVREVTDLILQTQGNWQELMKQYFDIKQIN